MSIIKWKGVHQFKLQMIKKNNNSTSTLFRNTCKFTLSQVYNLPNTSITTHISKYDSCQFMQCAKTRLLYTNGTSRHQGCHLMMQQKHHNHRQYGYKICHHQSWMHEHMTQQQCICSQQIVANNSLQYYTCNLHIQLQHLACISSTRQQPTIYHVIIHW